MGIADDNLRHNRPECTFMRPREWLLGPPLWTAAAVAAAAAPYVTVELAAQLYRNRYPESHAQRPATTTQEAMAQLTLVDVAMRKAAMTKKSKKLTATAAAMAASVPPPPAPELETRPGLDHLRLPLAAFAGDALAVRPTMMKDGGQYEMLRAQVRSTMGLRAPVSVD